MEIYQYHLLENNQIRLLDVIACDESPDDGQLRIEIALRVVNLDANPSYITMSYCWEGQQPDMPINCSQHVLMITRNVSKMIQYMTKHYSGKSLWIDAVCIDQNSKDDKNVQLPLMSRIYSGATMTVAWLGAADPDIDDMASKLPDMIITAEENKSINNFVTAKWEALGIKKNAPGSWLGLYKLFHRPWFRRLWVRQEYVLSRDLLMVCGESQFNSKQLEDLVADNYGFILRCIGQIGQKVKPNFEAPAMSFNLSKHHSQSRKRQGERWEGLSLPSFVIGAQDLLAFDSRDLIYGLLGMTTKAWQRNFPADYKTTAVDVFISFAWHWIAEDPGLQALCLASSTERMAELPTWVANIGQWKQAKAMAIYPQEQYSAGSATTSVDKSTLNHFSIPNPQLSLSKKLSLAGFQVDVLSEVIPPGWGKIQPGTTKTAALASLSWVDQCLRLWNYNTPKAAFARTLIGNDKLLQLQSQDELGISQVFNTALLGFRGLLMPRIIPPLVIRYIQILAQFCPGRSFFMTEMGRIGLGPGDARKGDVVVIFFGAAVPFVLRPDMEQLQLRIYELIGETYVDGIMYGEALESDIAKVIGNFTLV